MALTYLPFSGKVPGLRAEAKAKSVKYRPLESEHAMAIWCVGRFLTIMHHPLNVGQFLSARPGKAKTESKTSINKYS